MHYGRAGVSIRGKSINAGEISNQNIIRLKTVTSTQDALKAMLKQGIAEGTVVVAEEQTEGRGRQGRSWFSPAGKGLWMSILIKPDGPESLWTWVSLWAGVVVKKVVDRFLMKESGGDRHKIELKWPNDVLVDNNKICGILAENVQDSDGTKAVALGIGMNVVQKRGDFPPSLRNQSTSLFDITGKRYSLDEVLERLMQSITEMNFLLKPVQGKKIRRLWLDSAWGFEHKLHVTCGMDLIEGQFIGLGPNGELCLRTNDQQAIQIASADEIKLLKHESKSF